MTRSGKLKSGSRSRVAASKVARETPSCCACGHKDCKKDWNAGSPVYAPRTPQGTNKRAQKSSGTILIVPHFHCTDPRMQCVTMLSPAAAVAEEVPCSESSAVWQGGHSRPRATSPPLWQLQIPESS